MLYRRKKKNHLDVLSRKKKPSKIFHFRGLTLIPDPDRNLTQRGTVISDTQQQRRASSGNPSVYMLHSGDVRRSEFPRWKVALDYGLWGRAERIEAFSNTLIVEVEGRFQLLTTKGIRERKKKHYLKWIYFTGVLFVKKSFPMDLGQSKCASIDINTIFYIKCDQNW